MAAQRIADRADLGFRRFGNSVPYRVVEVALMTNSISKRATRDGSSCAFLPVTFAVISTSLSSTPKRLAAIRALSTKQLARDA
jgi:hypothetical protein